jgi:nitrous oxide reductase
MALLDELRVDQLAARKLNDRLKADVLTTLIGEATQITTEEFKRGVTEVTDEKVVATIAKFLKNTKLTLENLATERARLIEAGGDASKVDERTKAAETEAGDPVLVRPKADDGIGTARSHQRLSGQEPRRQRRDDHGPSEVQLRRSV